MKVRLLSHGCAPGKLNMAIDQAIQTACQLGHVPPTLRFYQWDPPCLSLGYFQDAAREVDEEGLRTAGIDLVRRPTGGKAVLHDDELTYSVILPESFLPGSVLETYCTISRGLVSGLRKLGVPAELAALERGVTPRDERFRQAACFSAPSWYEIVCNGKKIVGSAQCRKGGVILQHGSILFSFDAAKMVKCIRTASAENKKKLEFMLSQRATGINQVLGRDVSRRELESAVKAGFEEELGWELVPGFLTEEEISEAERLSSEKYGSRVWTFTRGQPEEDLYES